VGSETDIAVVGVGCRFPDARNPADFWRNIGTGLVSAREVPDEELLLARVSAAELRAPDLVRVAARLPNVTDFAGRFFGYTPEEAEAIDPQQRLFLEVCWEALESAGHPAFSDAPITGVFAGCHAGPYSARLLAAKAEREGWMAAFGDVSLHLGGLGDFLAARVGYKLGLRGPTVGIQAACSSALHAVHYAVLSLLDGECDIALAGGATVLEPVTGYRYSPGGDLSQDGQCRSFDARATGTNYSSGVGVVVLRRLSDAQSDGDTVLAVIRGTAVGNHGADRAGFTAPSPSGVADLVAAALRVAGVPGERLAYVEAHGSGTVLGDQIELRGLSKGLRTSRTGFCGLGSVKANIGHAGPAAGIAGLIKAVHIARTGELPPHPLFERQDYLANSPFTISSSGGRTDDPERAVLVNTIGFGGTNAAAVLGAPPPPLRAGAPEPGLVRLVLSARSQLDLDEMCARLADELEPGELPLGDVAYTLRVGRARLPVRRIVTAPPADVVEMLRKPTVDAEVADMDEPVVPGRRIPLPTYPFQRERYWALDRLASGATND
jgi:phthiocerol/phenolphthiocerol synthesis type-I polyketide synthase E